MGKIVVVINNFFEAEGQEFARHVRSIHLNCERSDQFLKQNIFLNLGLEVSIKSNTLEPRKNEVKEL